MIPCPACGHANRPGRRYCAQCGGAVVEAAWNACPNCGAANGDDDKFCGACGTALRGADAPSAERRHLTILFCDIVGSTALSFRLDAEEWRDVVGRYQRTVAGVIRRLGGRVAKFVGDGVVAHFGYPHAHDDDVERAVRAGLAIVDAIEPLNAQLLAANQLRLQVRIGIHTGPVVIGEAGGAEIDVFGEAPNIAARVQAAAEPDAVFVTASTHRLVAGRFVAESRGRYELKGVATPLLLYRVLRPRERRSRFHGAATHELTPFVGRTRERRLLRACYQAVHGGAGQVVLITGKPGIGKSRLAHTLRESLRGEARWVECEGSPYQQNTPFFPVTEMLRQLLAWRDDESPTEQAVRLERTLERDGLDRNEAVPLLAPLLGLPVPERYAPLLLSSDGARRRLLSTLASWVLRTARIQPLVVFVEDLQWVDASTLELLSLLLDDGATAPLLLLYTARDEFEPPWPLPPHGTRIVLTPLGRVDTRALVRHVSAGEPLADEITDAIVARSDGVPLFVEELTRFLAEHAQEGRPVALHAIPETLQDPLMARLDQLGAPKEIAQLGAVIGRRFSYTLLHAVSGLDPVVLDGALQHLVDSKLIRVRGVPPASTYTFNHALMQERAYDSLLKSRRRELHAAIARVLVERFADIVALQPEVVARHYTEAGDATPAIAAWQRAGALAAERSAHAEAAGHFAQALAVLALLPDGPSRDQQEFMVQLLLGHSLGTRSYADPRVAEVFARARQLGERLQDSTQLFFPLLGMWGTTVNRGEVRAARELSDQLLDSAQRSGTPIEIVWGHFTTGATRYYAGELRVALEHLERVLALYVREPHPFSPIDVGVAAQCYAARVAWALGDADTARAHARQAIAAAYEHGNAYDCAWAHTFACVVQCSCRDPSAVLVHVEPVMTPAIEQQFAQFYAIAVTLRGWALAQRGELADGIAGMRDGLARHLATGQRIAYRYFLALLAELYGDTGAVAEGVRLVEDGLAASSGDELFLPELLRVRGRLLAQGGDAAAADASFRDAIETARRHGAKFHELRALSDLCRLLGDGPRGAEPRCALAALVATITEGADLPDVRAARQLGATDDCRAS